MKIFKMKKQILFFILASLLLGCEHSDTELSQFIEQRELCDHFRGKISGDATDNDQDLQTELDKYCKGTDNALLQLKQKYKNDPKIAQQLNEYEENIEPNSTIEELITKYNQDVIYTSLFFINKDINAAYSNKHPDFNYCSLEQNVTNFIQNNHQLLKIVTSQDVVLTAKWEMIDKKIKSITPMESDEDINFTDVIFYMPKAHFLYTPYLVKPEYIDNYNSIGEDNICKLYYDILSYLITLDDENLTAFFDEYTVVYHKLIK